MPGNEPDSVVQSSSRESDADLRRAREALDRLKVCQMAADESDSIPGAGNALRHLATGMIPALVIWIVIVALSRSGALGSAIGTKWGGTGTNGVPYVVILSSVGVVVVGVWKLVAARRRLRDRRAALKAKRAGLCTCNYPRPPGMLKCPECGGAMVMK